MPDTPIVLSGGNAYALRGGALMTAPVLADGTVDGAPDAWGEVQPDILPRDAQAECRRIADALTILAD